jgi:hypothetical protein
MKRSDSVLGRRLPVRSLKRRRAAEDVPAEGPPDRKILKPLVAAMVELGLMKHLARHSNQPVSRWLTRSFGAWAKPE